MIQFLFLHTPDEVCSARKISGVIIGISLLFIFIYNSVGVRKVTNQTKRLLKNEAI